MNPITYSKVNNKSTMMMIFITQILIVVVFLLGMLVLSKGVIELKNDSFQLFENLNKQLVKKKGG